MAKSNFPMASTSLSQRKIRFLFVQVDIFTVETMHIISRKPFNNAAKLYPNERTAIEMTYKVLRNGTFRNPNELKSVFPSLDNFKYKDKWWVIDIGGNNLRLIAFIEFRDNRMYVKHIATHAEYDKLCDKYAKESKK